MRTTRALAVGAVALLVALVLGAVALAATAPGAPTVVASRLDVPAGPPSTATGVLTYSDGSGITARADCAFDFASGSASVTATATLAEVADTLEVRLVERTVYLDVSEFSTLIGADWISVTAPPGPDRLAALARTLRHPDLSRLKGRRTVTVDHAGDRTTTVAVGRVSVPFAPRLPIVAVPPFGRLTVAVTTGPQGQLLAASLRLVAPGDTVQLSFQVTGYDVPVTVTAPAGAVPLTRHRATQIFGTDAPAIEHVLRDVRRIAG